MAHDGAQMLDNSKHSPVLGDLLALTGAAIGPAEALLARATDKVRELVSDNGTVITLTANQTTASDTNLEAEIPSLPTGDYSVRVLVENNGYSIE